MKWSDLSDCQHHAGIAKQQEGKECEPNVKVRPVTAKRQIMTWLNVDGQKIDKMTVQLKNQHQHQPHFSMQISPACGAWTSNGEAVITSADGPIVAPADVAVRHAETADALRALQLVAFVAGEMHGGSPPADPSQRGINALTLAKVSWKNTKVLSSSGAPDNVELVQTHRGHKAM